MKIINSKQQINGADAPGRGYSSAPWNICCKPFNNSKEVLQNGRSMIEMLGVLAIIGVLSVGGIAGYSKAMQKYRVNKTIEQITLIAGNIRAFFGPQKNYIGVYCRSSGIINRNDGICNTNGCNGHSGVGSNGNPTTADNGCPIIKKAKILPDEMITVENGKIMGIVNPFGYAVGLGYRGKAKINDYQAFSIYYDIGGRDIESCIELSTHDWTNAGVVALDFYDYEYDYVYKTPISVDDAVTLCEVAAGIYFMFDIDSNSDYWKERFSSCAYPDGQC